VFTRAKFLSLIGTTPTYHTMMKRRDLVPVPNRGDREYTLFEAFTYLLSERFSQSPDGEGMPLPMARDVVRDAARQLAARGPDIEESSLTFRHDAGVGDIMVGRIKLGDRNVPFVGTRDELAAELGALGTVLGINVTNASGMFAVLRVRAEHEGIAISDVWPDPETLPSQADRVAGIMASWRAAVGEANAKRGQRD
jgi:hypothetical protein